MKIVKSLKPIILDECKSKRVLYIGVGDERGNMSYGAQLSLSVASEWHGIEIDDRVIEQYPDLDIRKIDLNGDLPDDLPEVDIVVMTEVLEHLESPVGTLRKLGKVFSGCEFLASVPNCLSIGRILSALISRKKYFYQDGNHMMLFNFMTLQATFKGAGLKDVEIFGYNRHLIFQPFVMIKPDFCVGFGIKAGF